MLSSARAPASMAARVVARSLSGGKKVRLCGVFPPLPTPFNHDESIAYDKLESNMRTWNQKPFEGYVIHGSNGEYPFLTPEERVEMVRRVRAMVPEEKTIIAGSSCESTSLTVKTCNLVAEAGADAVLLLPPSYFKANMTEAVLAEHFKAVADNCPVPVVLYNMPANVGLDMSAALLARLAEHPNIAGVKDSGGDITKMATVVKDTKHLDFSVVAGSGGVLLPALLVGCTGGILGIANMLGDEACRIYQLFKESKLPEAVELHHRILTPNSLVTRVFGVPAMKAAMDYCGLYGGPCRRPLVKLSPDQLRQVHEAFKSAGFEPRN
ncbi:4-hydroxy-2-oxoglutarate aldolase, mitochondrial-like [Bacillus rossius redtenbacheri]|uniref:4-hydroxy-2-oxoglutarate aldolase, mitochondrial-like n=1 Tax=Bacillus rossius redtenbacheri TaxID=93214 RepID=UPI002FDDAFB2